MHNIERVSIVGLGKLGLPIAATLASKGYTVIGVDRDPEVREAVQQRKAPFYEPGLTERLRRAERLVVTDDVRHAVQETDATFILVPTPSKPNGEFSLDAVLDVVEQVGKGLQEKNTYHVVAISSTVSPGSTNGPIRERLQHHASKRRAQDFGLCYNPEFVALGEVIHGYVNPDFVLIGESDETAGTMLEDFVKNVCENKPRVARMSLVEAELTKIALNTYVTMKISFANLLARLCEKTAGADVDTMTRALGLDSRIGPNYLKGTVPYGGPCFPRDNAALAQYARSIDVDASLPETVDAFNRRQIADIALRVREHLPSGGIVGILGLSYKPNTAVVDESFGIGLAHALARNDIPVIVHDPYALDNARNFLPRTVVCAPTIQECIDKSDVVVLATPWKELVELPPSQYARNGKKHTIIDCWRVLNPIALDGIATYHAVGKGYKHET